MAVDTLFDAVRVLTHGSDLVNRAAATQIGAWAVAASNGTDVTPGAGFVSMSPQGTITAQAAGASGYLFNESWQVAPVGSTYMYARGATYEVVYESPNTAAFGDTVLSGVWGSLKVTSPGFISLNGNPPINVGTGKVRLAVEVLYYEGGNTGESFQTNVFATSEAGLKTVTSGSSQFLGTGSTNGAAAKVVIGSVLQDATATPPSELTVNLVRTQQGSTGTPRATRVDFRTVMSATHVRMPDPGAVNNTAGSFTYQAGSSVSIAATPTNSSGVQGAPVTFTLAAAGLEPTAALSAALQGLAAQIPGAVAFFVGSQTPTYGPTWNWVNNYRLDLPCTVTTATWAVSLSAVQNFSGAFYMYDGNNPPGQYLVSASPHRIADEGLNAVGTYAPYVLQGSYLSGRKTVYTATVTKTGTSNYYVYVTNPQYSSMLSAHVPVGDLASSNRVLATGVSQALAGVFNVTEQAINSSTTVLTLQSIEDKDISLLPWSATTRASTNSAVSKLYGLRVTGRNRSRAPAYGNNEPYDFFLPPWPTSTIPPSTGGGGGAAAPTVWDATYDTDLTYTNSSRTAAGTASQGFAKSVFGAATGLWYFEVTLDAGNIRGMVGVGSPGASPVGSYPGDTGTDIIALYRFNDSTYSNGTVDPIGVTPGDVIGVLFDASAMTVRWKLDSSTLTTAVAIPGTGPVHAIFGSGDPSNSVEGTLNSGQAAFVHGLPVGANPVFGDGSVWGTLPADVIFAVNAESNGNDVAQFGLSATASGTATIQASGSRTSDGYLRNTDSAQMADACFGYTPNAGFKAAWGAAQSMTLEFDIRVDTGAFLGGQILGIGPGYSSLSDNGPSGIAITGSPFAVSAGSATLTPGTWHHIAFVADYNAGDRLIRTYRDGVQQDTPQSVLAFNFNDYPNPTTIGLLQLQAGFIGNGALKGGMDNIVLTTRAKYNANFTPGASFPEIVGYTPPPSNIDVTCAGYNDVEEFISDGAGNTQANAPDAYGTSNVVLVDTEAAYTAYVDAADITGTGTTTLAAATNVGTGVAATPTEFTADYTLDDFTSVADGVADMPLEFTADYTLDDFTGIAVGLFLAPVDGGGDALLDDFFIEDFTASTITPPTAQAAFSLPMLRATASGSPAVFNGALITLPTLTAAAQGGHYSTFSLPRITAEATGTTIAMARAIMTVPMVEVEATGRVAGQSSVQTRLPRIEVSSFGGHQAEITLPEITATATATVGSAAQAELSLPRITVTAHGYRDDTARADITLPMLVMTPSAVAEITLPAFTVLAHGQPVLTNAYEAYVLNMNQPLDDNPRNNFEAKVEQVTRYTNWPFIQVVRLGSTYYGVAEDGLYELGGTTDNGTEITWSFETCKTDFDDPHKKAVASAYIGGQAGATVDYTLRSGDDVDHMYGYVTTKVIQKRNHRQKFGLGRRVRYYSFGLAGSGKAAIDMLEFELLNTTRRI